MKHLITLILLCLLLQGCSRHRSYPRHYYVACDSLDTFVYIFTDTILTCDTTDTITWYLKKQSKAEEK